MLGSWRFLVTHAQYHIHSLCSLSLRNDWKMFYKHPNMCRYPMPKKEKKLEERKVINVIKKEKRQHKHILHI